MSRSQSRLTHGRTGWGSPSRTLTVGTHGGRSENLHDIILVPSSPELQPMPSFASMPPPATTTTSSTSATKFSLQDLSFSSSPSLPSRTAIPPLDDGVDKRPESTPHLPSSPAREYVTLDSTPDSTARLAQSAPPPGATRSVYFPDDCIPSSQIADGSKADFQSPLPANLMEADIAAPQPERYETGDLMQAVQRRRDWTPPPTDTSAFPGTRTSSSPPVEDWSSPRAAASSVHASTTARADVFKTLHNSYSCKEDTVATVAASGKALPSKSTVAPIESFLAKRKPIEAVSIGGGSDSSSSNKLPAKAAPKKKPRTITELAMAAYADSPLTEAEDELVVPEPTVPKRRGRPKRQVEAIEENTNEPLPTQPAVVRPGFPTTKLRKLQTAAAVSTTPDGKKAKKPRKKPAPRTKKQVVLSPESARTESMQQDFLFGTSSQLAADESPTFLRQLQAAMQESNVPNEDEHEADRKSLTDLFEDASEIDLTAAASPGTLPGASARAVSVAARSGRKTKLWGAAWRGEDGQVTSEHVIDLEDGDAVAFPEDPHQVLALAQKLAEQHGEEKTADCVDLAGAASNKTAKAGKAAKSGKVGKAAKGIQAKSTLVSQTQPAQHIPSSPPLGPVAGARSKILSATQLPSKAKLQGQTEARTQARLPLPSLSSLLSSSRAAATATTASTSSMLTSELPTPAPASSAALSTGPLSTASIPAVSEAPAQASAPISVIKRPNFDIMTTAQLSQKVSSYGYKAMKVRSAMVALLNQCWDAKNGMPPGAVQTASLSTTSAAAAPVASKTKACGKSAATLSPRPRRITKLTTKARAKKKTPPPEQPERVVYEIEDSEASDGGRFSSPEVPCSVASDACLAYDSEGIESDYEAVGELGEAMMDDEMDETLAAEPTCEEARLFRLITEAVTTAPSSTNPTQPSWHEKMLMYDTIILEEFTEWLNHAVSVSTEITGLQAKKWCESKSVCCTWRKNTRGRERKL